MLDIEKIVTEQRNERTAHIDELSTLEMVRLINDEDKKVAYAVEETLEPIACAIDLITERMRKDGRLIYCGCGTSGRLGILDAVECPPTYSTEPELVQGIIAGGYSAVFHAVEGAEDNYEQGGLDLKEISFSARDILVGIAASGRTPYVIGAMNYAKSIGAAVISVTCCPGSKMGEIADIDIAPSPGPEVVTGSTRMKSGTAQKMILNMLSTGAMIKLGKVYGNLMVDVKPSNEKLIQRCISIVRTSALVSEEEAINALEQCGYNPKTAIVMLICKLEAEAAKELLVRAEGKIAKAVQIKKHS
jgi:N-acetylmuramic acid 6-phosphate etherase